MLRAFLDPATANDNALLAAFSILAVASWAVCGALYWWLS